MLHKIYGGGEIGSDLCVHKYGGDGPEVKRPFIVLLFFATVSSVRVPIRGHPQE